MLGAESNLYRAIVCMLNISKHPYIKRLYQEPVEPLGGGLRQVFRSQGRWPSASPFCFCCLAYEISIPLLSPDTSTRDLKEWTVLSHTELQPLKLCANKPFLHVNYLWYFSTVTESCLLPVVSALPLAGVRAPPGGAHSSCKARLQFTAPTCSSA